MEVFDISRNEWCLVRPVGRPADQEDEDDVEGWVPASFLKPYSGGGFGKSVVMLPQIYYTCINVLSCSYMAFIGVHEMHSQMHPNQRHVTILLDVIV